MKLPWRRDADGHKLSAYVDGELDEVAEVELSDRLVFDQNLREAAIVEIRKDD